MSGERIKPEDEDLDPDVSGIPVVPFQGHAFVIMRGESHMGCKFGKNAWATSMKKRQGREEGIVVFVLRWRSSKGRRPLFHGNATWSIVGFRCNGIFTLPRKRDREQD